MYKLNLSYNIADDLKVHCEQHWLASHCLRTVRDSLRSSSIGMKGEKEKQN
jgi:hypothetical protein